ncbi:acyltransferase domain-containing protein [Streptomyces uncialis]|uniref:acyltransferase domain-containing protein n=1 Tax=Streptomyces uncialis TaxID=1048205 RepID=UPI003816ABF1
MPTPDTRTSTRPDRAERPDREVARSDGQRSPHETESPAQRRAPDAPGTPGPLPPALLMPGQGAQYQGMGTGLYRDLPAFAAAVDEVFLAMGTAGDELRADWLAAGPRLPIHHFRRSQPLLFALDHALGRLLMDRGLKPAALLGHSVGEMAAAALAGVFDLADAARIVCHRIGRLDSAPAGGMAAVAATRTEIEPYLRPGVDIGAVNAPRQTVIAGADEPLGRTLDALREAGFRWARVHSVAPFHSTVLQPVVDAARPLLAALPARAPRITMVSGYTAQRLTDAEAVDPSYWARHPVDPVLFWPALETLVADGPRLLVECGPGQGLTTLARQLRDVRSGRCEVLSLLGPPGSGPDREAEHFTTALARLGLRAP